MSYDIGPYDPCPCGSGAKYKFCCAAKHKDQRHGKFPIGTVAWYGPDDKTTTKIAASVILREGASPILQRWHGEDLATDGNVSSEIKQFFAKHGVKTVGAANRNLGCPHEEGVDFSVGNECPFCPFWKGKQGIGRRTEWLNSVLGPVGNTFAEFCDGPEFDDAEDDLDDEELDEDDQDESGLDGEDLDEGSQDEDSGIDFEASLARMNVVLGNRELDFSQAVSLLAAHVSATLQRPCEVRGSDDFNWEEPYIFGDWSQSEYKRLKKTQPSSTDRYELLEIDCEAYSEWMLCSDDVAAHVRRLSDGKEFYLGLSELEAIDKKSPNYALLQDYGLWFWNNR
jgi:hypothetical protein